jgi:catechol 2,3-dioxygenase-like lactoylglutathione lyase family enzyme
MATLLRRLHHVHITVPRDGAAAARAFYGDLLGLEEIPRPPGITAFAWYRLGDGQVHVAGEERGVTRSRRHVAFEVDDLATLKQRLLDRGVAVADGIDLPDVDRFFARDPFGNRLEFIQASD